MWILASGSETNPQALGRGGFPIHRWFGAILLVLGLLLADRSHAQDPVWMISPSLGFGGLDLDLPEVGGSNMSFSLDGKRHLQGREWVGLELAAHSYFAIMSHFLNSPHALYTATPTYSYIFLGDYAHAAFTTGLGVYVLRENTNIQECSDFGWNFGGAGTRCGDQAPPDVWKTHAGFVVPFSVQLGLHFGFLGVFLQPAVGGVVPITDKPKVEPWGHFKFGLNLFR